MLFSVHDTYFEFIMKSTRIQHAKDKRNLSRTAHAPCVPYTWTRRINTTKAKKEKRHAVITLMGNL